MSSKLNNNITSLYNYHLKLKAKMVPFAGYLMPVNYENGISHEYNSVRNNIGIFDVSHMGKIFIDGLDAVNFLDSLTTNNIYKLSSGDAQYNLICNNTGGVIDDIIVYKKNNSSFMLIVNASNIKKIYKWLISNKKKYNISIQNNSKELSIIAVQGPKSREILNQIFNLNIRLKFYTFMEFEFSDYNLTLSRTGYTGELGFELIVNNEIVGNIWELLINNNAIPCGLGVRDVLRTEMKYCLYGNDLDENINPIQSGLKWVVDLKKKNFIGKSNIDLEIKNPTMRMICFEMIDKAIPRHNYKIFYDGNEIGYITSGTYSIGLKKGIGFGLVDFNYIKYDSFYIQIRNRLYEAKKVKPPFIKNYSLHS